MPEQVPNKLCMSKYPIVEWKVTRVIFPFLSYSRAARAMVIDEEVEVTIEP